MKYTEYCLTIVVIEEGSSNRTVIEEEQLYEFSRFMNDFKARIKKITVDGILMIKFYDDWFFSH